MNDTGTGQFFWQEALPLQQIAAVAALLVAAVIWMYWRQRRERAVAAVAMAGLRCLVIGILAWVLMGPSFLPPAAEKNQRSQIHVLLDTSASMQTADVAGRSRMEQVIARWLNPERQAELEKDFDLVWSRFDAQVAPLDPQSLAETAASDLARGPVSDYVAALTSGLNAAPAQSILLVLGDGHDSQESPLAPLARLARDRGQAIYAVGAGSRKSPVDLAILAQAAPPLVMVGEEGRLQLKIAQAGLTGATALVRVEGPDLQDSRTLRLDRGLSSLQWPLKPQKPGAYRYRVRVEPLAGEITTANNTQDVFLEVTDRRMRVLILEGEPYWETKFIAQVLRIDPRIEVHQLMQVAGDKRQTLVNQPGSRAVQLPEKSDDWSGYDVVVLGRGMENILNVKQAADLVESVRERGLHLVLARGRCYDPATALGSQLAAPLALAEPVVWGHGPVREGRLRLAPAGRSHPAFMVPEADYSADAALNDLGGLSAIPTVESLRPATLVLAETADAPNVPAVVTMPLGRGTVLAVLGEGLWRWRLLSTEQDRYRGFYDNFWSSGLRGLVLSGRYDPGLPVSLRLSRSVMAPDEKISIDVLSRSVAHGLSGLELSVIDPDGEVFRPQLKPLAGISNHAQIKYQPQKQGSWSVRLTGPVLGTTVIEKPFGVYQIDLERLMPEARPHVLRNLAELSGGMFFDVEENISLAAVLRRQKLSQQVPPEPLYTWDRGLILGILVLLLGLEWLGRRQWGWA